jgi:hypothetical protein
MFSAPLFCVISLDLIMCFYCISFPVFRKQVEFEYSLNNKKSLENKLFPWLFSCLWCGSCADFIKCVNTASYMTRKK